MMLLIGLAKGKGVTEELTSTGNDGQVSGSKLPEPTFVLERIGQRLPRQCKSVQLLEAERVDASCIYHPRTGFVVSRQESHLNSLPGRGKLRPLELSVCKNCSDSHYT